MSRITSLAIPATAGNVSYNISPNNLLRRWKIHRLHISLTCDATVATRNIILYQWLSGSGTVVGPAIKGADVAASATTRLSIGMTDIATGSTFIYEANATLQQPLVLDQFNTLRITINNGVVGDSFTGTATYEEEPSGS